MSPLLPPDGAEAETVRTPYPLYPLVGEAVTEPVAADRVIPAEPAIDVTPVFEITGLPATPSPFVMEIPAPVTVMLRRAVVPAPVRTAKPVPDVGILLASTKAVVATCVVLVPIAAVGATGMPVNVGASNVPVVTVGLTSVGVVNEPVVTVGFVIVGVAIVGLVA